MFSALASEIQDRVLDTKSFFAATRKFREGPTVAIAKGLAFVQLYAIYEHSATGIVRAALAQAKRRGTLIKHCRLELLGLALQPELTAVMDAGKGTSWPKR